MRQNPWTLNYVNEECANLTREEKRKEKPFWLIREVKKGIVYRIFIRKAWKDIVRFCFLCLIESLYGFILMFYRSFENRLSPFWILQVYAIICNMEGRHRSKLKVWQPSANKCWAFLFQRFDSWIPIFCLFDAQDKILFFLVTCYFIHPGCFVIIVYAIVCQFKVKINTIIFFEWYL